MNVYSELSKIVRANNINKLIKKLEGVEDEGRKLLREFRYLLDKYVF